MAPTVTHRLTHVIFSTKVFLRPFRAHGVVGLPNPGLAALGYFPMPLRGVKIT